MCVCVGGGGGGGVRGGNNQWGNVFGAKQQGNGLEAKRPGFSTTGRISQASGILHSTND